MSRRGIASDLTGLNDLPFLLETAEDFAPLLDALGQGRAGTIDGAWNSSASLVAATLARHAPQPLLIVLAHPRDADAWSEDLVSFAGQVPVLFPAWDALPTKDTVIDEVAGQRLRVLRQLEEEPPRLLLTTLQALLQPVPDRAQLIKQRRRLKVGSQADLEEVTAWLVEHAFQRMEAVELPGEFSRRGGILDVFSLDAEAPYRIEFVGDDIESIRQFSPESQRSLGDLTVVEITGSRQSGVRSQESGVRSQGAGVSALTGHVCDYLPDKAWTVLVEPEDLHEQGKHYLERVADARGLFSIAGAIAQLTRFPSVRLTAIPSASMETICHLRVESVERFSGDVTKVKDELDSVAESDQVLIACHNEAERKRLGEVLASSRLAQTDRLRLVVGRVHAGFRLLIPEARGLALGLGVVVLGDHELFHREETRIVKPRRQLEARAIDSFLDLGDGDLVVHVSHGIARYCGMEVLDKNGHTEEHLILEFREGTRVYVPVSKIDLVQKYVGGARTDPELSKLGGTSWQKKKDRVEAAVMDLASDMIELQALRESQPGIAYPPDSEWQAEFEATFPYQDTPDQ